MINPSNQQSSIERDRKRDPNLAYENKILLAKKIEVIGTPIIDHYRIGGV